MFSKRTKLVFSRVPTIFLLQRALVYQKLYVPGPSSSETIRDINATTIENQYSNSLTILFWNLVDYYDAVWPSLFYKCFNVQITVLIICLFLFKQKNLSLNCTQYAAGIATIIISELDMCYMMLKTSFIENSIQILQSCANHCIIVTTAILFSFTHTKPHIPFIIFLVLNFAPLISCILAAPLCIVKITPFVTILTQLALLTFITCYTNTRLYEMVDTHITSRLFQNFNSTLITKQVFWTLYFQMFQTYWITRFALYLIVNTARHGICDSQLFQKILLNGTETIIDIIALGCIIASIFQLIITWVLKFLQMAHESLDNAGKITGVLFIILYLNGSAHELEYNKYHFICHNLSLINTGLLYSLYVVVNERLTSLKSYEHLNVQKHFRALIASIALILSACVFFIHQWNTQTSLGFMLTMGSFTLEIIIKILTSITIYILFLLDTYTSEAWENYDDYLFYLKTLALITEFFSGIILVPSGLMRIALQPRPFRMCILLLHIYYNVWMKVKQVYSDYSQRQISIKKVKFFRAATKEELDIKNDSCAICCQHLNAAIITNCNHYFHKNCIRKSLETLNKCPLCHKNPFGK